VNVAEHRSKCCNEDEKKIDRGGCAFGAVGVGNPISKLFSTIMHLSETDQKTRLIDRSNIRAAVVGLTDSEHSNQSYFFCSASLGTTPRTALNLPTSMPRKNLAGPTLKIGSRHAVMSSIFASVDIMNSSVIKSLGMPTAAKIAATMIPVRSRPNRQWT
jgi:hypothetical protein